MGFSNLYYDKHIEQMMKNLPLNLIAERINGDIIRGKRDMMIDGVVLSIRRIRPGVLYFDLTREQPVSFPTNRIKLPYAIVTDRPVFYTSIPGDATVIQVADITKAYWRFVRFYRSLFSIPIIGVTGTCGKTTTKEMIKHILSGSYKINATYKSYNALFRNLAYLLEIDESTQAAVYEMGVAFPGDLKISCRYFKPQVGVITNIGVDHLQAFRTQEAYIRAKAELLTGLDARGTLILNGDDPNSRTIDVKKFKGQIFYFGFGDESHFQMSNVAAGDGVIEFTLRHDNDTCNISIPGHGEFNAYNATAAIVAANAVGIPIADAAKRLATFRNVEKHFELKRGINGSLVIDDTWSTNPTSVEAALNLLKSHAQGKTTCAVLGKMSLLGRASAAYHFKTGEIAAAIGIDQLVVLGDGADEIGSGALQNGMKPENIHFCKDSAAARKVLETILNANSIVLVKTSMMASYADLIKRIVAEYPNDKPIP